MNLDIKAFINGQEVFLDQVHALEYERNKHVLHEMKALGANVNLNGKELTHVSIDALSQADAKLAGFQSRSQYSSDEIREIYKDRIAVSDAMWKDINKNFKMGDKMKAGTADFEIHGLDPQTLAKAMSPEAAGNGNDETQFATNPEHFILQSAGNGLHVMEAFGMYGEPTDMLVEGVEEDELNINLPIAREEDYPLVSIGNPLLYSDHTPINNIPFHQFKPLADGIKVKSAIFVPTDAPDEIVKGHEWHLVTEFWEQMLLIQKDF